MKRLILATFLGFFGPFVYLITIGFISDQMSRSLLTDIKIGGESAPGILFAPVSVPIYLDIWLKKMRWLPLVFDTFLFRFSSFIFFNAILYGMLIYVILGRLARWRKQKMLFSESPPPPPNFEQTD